MKYTVLEIVNASKGIMKLVNVPLDSTVSFKIYQLKTELDKVAENYNKVNNDLIKNKYGEEREKEPGVYDVPQKNQEAYYKEIKKLGAEEVKIDAKPILLSTLIGVQCDLGFFSAMGKFVLEK